MTKSERVLIFIGEAGLKGRTFSEIQRYIVVELNGLDWDERQPIMHAERGPDGKYRMVKRGEVNRRRYRGYWTDRLLGGPYSSGGHGLLRTFCRKNSEGRWVLWRPIAPPFKRPYRFRANYYHLAVCA